MSAALPPETFLVAFLAPIPVGHHVQLDFHEHAVGLLGGRRELATHYPLVTDLGTGVVWGAPEHFGRDGFDPAARPSTALRVVGVVRSCFVSSNSGPAHDRPQTQLVVEVQLRSPRV